MSSISTLHEIDVHIGNRIRLARTKNEITQDDLDKNAGLPDMQTSKYEDESGRISSVHLWAISRRLDVEPSYFFEGLEDDAFIEYRA